MNDDKTEVNGEALELSRRGFLGRVAGALSAVAVIIVTEDKVFISAGAEASQPDEQPAQAPYDPNKHRYVFLIDITKCIGCGACVRACEKENSVPAHHFRTWIERYMISRTGETRVDSPNGGRDSFDPVIVGEEITKAFFVPKLCNHCSNSPCVQLCPVGASYRSPDGVVLVDEKRCIGCGYCVQACPYGSRFIHPEMHVASKCTLCYHRTTKGLPTACVQACPRGVRKVGDAMQLHDEVSEIIATKQVHLLKPELLTEPQCHYVGLSKEVR